jgi:hypothetical protein
MTIPAACRDSATPGEFVLWLVHDVHGCSHRHGFLIKSTAVQHLILIKIFHWGKNNYFILPDK